MIKKDAAAPRNKLARRLRPPRPATDRPLALPAPRSGLALPAPRVLAAPRVTHGSPSRTTPRAQEPPSLRGQRRRSCACASRSPPPPRAGPPGRPRHAWRRFPFRTGSCASVHLIWEAKRPFGWCRGAAGGLCAATCRPGRATRPFATRAVSQREWVDGDRYASLRCSTVRVQGR